VKNGTFGFTRHGAGDQRLAGARRADQQHAARNAAAKPLEFRRIAQEFDDLLEVLLGLIDAGDVLEGDAAVRLGQELGPALAEASALPPAPCIWRDRKIQTPISAMNGNHDTSSDTNHGTLSPCARAVIDTPLSYRALDERRVARRIGLEGAAVGEVP